MHNTAPGVFRRYNPGVPGSILTAFAIALPGLVLVAQSSLPDAELRKRIPPRRAFDHSARIVTDKDLTTGGMKVWILPGEDDMRLYSPNGAQMEMDFQISYVLPGSSKALPTSVSLLFETHGETRPARPPLALRLVADGRSLALEETPQPMSRSGGLVFYATSAKMPLADFLTLVNASHIQGRCWGHEFVLTAPQLEILRDLASRML